MPTRKIILRVNAVFLLVVGLAQAVFELLGHFLGVGPLAGRFTTSLYTIGFFEAHCLAALIGLMMFNASLGKPKRFWHLYAISVHLLLGGANLLFWDSFVRLDFVVPGIVATVFHGAFILAQTSCYTQAKTEAIPSDTYA
jgi:hypothetical protein